jgi:hypothetical protein
VELADVGHGLGQDLGLVMRRYGGGNRGVGHGEKAFANGQMKKIG